MNVMILLLLVLAALAWILRSRQQQQHEGFSASGSASASVAATAAAAAAATAAAAAAVTNPCLTASSTQQQTYRINACQLYSDRYLPLLETVVDESAKARVRAKYAELKIDPTGARYTQTYLEIVRRFLEFDRFALTIGERLPTTYRFSAPVPIAIGDYLPTLITWQTPSANPKSYKCVAFSEDEQRTVTSVQQFAGTVDSRQQYVADVRQNICRAKGYYMTNATYASQGCTACANGCCMPSDEVLTPADVTAAEAAATRVCPKQTVRPFKIPSRKLRLRVVPPSLKEAVEECFVGATAPAEASGIKAAPAAINREIHQMLKNHKLNQLQQIPILQ
jgi:hypothetical protein